ncbi:adenosine receptor A2a isoform X2 [Tribolium madens]|uniref:adenosine receptor A2a isoform X2 n=1 Tax=Tribolium madens TaxID=41895 RepID=UPI001CF736C1|nr:adenosine receptor A2a isoform X2 [Tribolium madens]
MNSTNSTLLDYQKDEINLYYVICEVLVAVFAVIGNALVIFVFRKERRLRRRTNYYIVSLAAADFLVGLLGIPFAIMSSVGLPTNLHACLFTVSLLVVLCTISIFCLLAVSVDRYWAILHPMGYSRNVRTKTAIVIITVCWVTGSIVGFLPLMGWHKSAPSDGRCFFLGVMDYNYLVFLYFGTIITPALLLAAFYAHIYQVVLKQLRQIVTMNPENGSSSNSCSSGGTMLRVLGAAQKREVKATQNLAIIVLFFMICWIPLYTINCILAFCNDCKVDSNFMFSCIILSHLNSAGNPLLYAYHLRDFRAALKNFFCNLFGYSEAQKQQTL